MPEQGPTYEALFEDSDYILKIVYKTGDDPELVAQAKDRIREQVTLLADAVFNEGTIKDPFEALSLATETYAGLYPFLHGDANDQGSS